MVGSGELTKLLRGLIGKTFVLNCAGVVQRGVLTKAVAVGQYVLVGLSNVEERRNSAWKRIGATGAVPIYPISAVITTNTPGECLIGTFEIKTTTAFIVADSETASNHF